MHDKPRLTGAEAEARGALKFECDECRNRFPARCVKHDKRPKRARRVRTKCIVSTPAPKAPGNPPLSFERNPPHGYWGLYDGIITDITDLRRSLLTPRKQ